MQLEPLDPKPVRRANIWLRVTIGLMLVYGGIALVLQVIRMFRAYWR